MFMHKRNPTRVMIIEDALKKSSQGANNVSSNLSGELLTVSNLISLNP